MVGDCGKRENGGAALAGEIGPRSLSKFPDIRCFEVGSDVNGEGVLFECREVEW